MDNGECLLEYTWEGHDVEIYFKAFTIFTYITTYFLPVLAMAVWYV